jgi:indole-3-glycerol phosphate synthase
MSVLDSIIAGVLEDQAKRELSNSELEKKMALASKPLDVLAALSRDKFSIIAEVKRSSPSKGALAQISAPEKLARQYQDGGAAVISVLTEQRRFGGSLEDFSKVRGEVSIPLLRKDFIVNEYLVKESRAYGADLILLIVAALSDEELKQLYQLVKSLGMEALVEIHNQEELERALAINPRIVGVNARNLKTLEIDKSNFSQLLPLIPPGIIRIAESGMIEPIDGREAFIAGADAILVGEALVKSENPSTRVREFLNVANSYGKVD